MIVRTYFGCATCNHAHIVRIGLGHDSFQTHNFPCMKCGEELVVGMRIDQKNPSAVPEAVENCYLLDKVSPDATIVNVDANFVVAYEQRHQDGVFPRLSQVRELHDAVPPGVPPGYIGRPLDIGDEWIHLRKAWSLHRNKQDALAAAALSKASSFYNGAPIPSLAEWLWKFLSVLGQPVFDKKFAEAMKIAIPAANTARFSRFAHHYSREMSETRGSRYFDLMTEFFAAYSQFSQVFFQVSRGVPVPGGNMSSSTDFRRTKMFYGNAFEVCATSADFLAYVNNLHEGREFDVFVGITRAQYASSNKSRRFEPFLGCEPLAALCRERDNQLRNASHHMSLRYDPARQLLHYSPNSSSATNLSLGYATYLSRCVELFLQVAVIFRMELALMNATDNRLPL